MVIDGEHESVGTRLMALGAAAVTVAAGLGIRVLAQGDVSKYGADAFYTVLVYALSVVAVPRIRPLTAASVALGVSWAVEFFQLSPVPAELSRHSLVARLVLGTTFNAPDLLWYVVGAAFALLVHVSARRRKRGGGTGVRR
jgi:hypothetical protein